MYRTFLLACWFSFATIASFCQSGQRIDTSNYYNYVRDGGAFNWLLNSEAVPVIIEEIKNAGFSNAFIEVGRLIKIDKTTSLVVHVSFNNKEINFGFIYEGGHGIPVSVSDRDYLKDEIREAYTQAEHPQNGPVKFNRINPLPKNIFLLKERCYWFQFDEKGGLYPVTKELALKILIQDIRAYLNMMMATNQNLR
jgi:hypothetical protein